MAQLEYNVTREAGRKGQLADNGFHDILSRINDAPRAAQIESIAVTAVNDTDYALTIDGVLFEFTSDSSATADEIIDGFVALINADPLINPRVVASNDPGGDNLILTARTGGIGFEYSDDDANLAQTTTQADADADPVDFGALVVQDATEDRAAQLAASSVLTAKSFTLVPAEVNDATYYVTVTVDGVGYFAAFTADASATVQEIVEGLQAVLAGILPSSVAATEDNVSLILTAAQAGQGFTVSVGSDAATATWTVTEAGDDLNLVALGVAVREHSHEEIAQNDGDQYPAGSDMSVLRDGRIIVETEESVSPSNDVYVGLSAAEAGKWRGSAATGYVKLDASRARWSENLSDDLAVLQVRF